MRKHLLNIALGLSAIGGLMTSCYDDLGNYDYTELDEVVIDTVGLGIQPAYSIARYERLTIEPKVLFNGKEVGDSENSPVEYLWTIYTQGTSALTTTYVNDTLATTPKLDVDITPLAGSYVLQLTVTNKTDGVQQYLKIPCQVEESITAGWLLLYERADKPGTSDVGLVVNPLVKKNVIKDKEYWNLYSASNGETIDGSPVRIINPITTSMAVSTDVYCLTDKDFVSVNSATFAKVNAFEDLFYKAPEKKSVVWYGTSGMMQRRNFLINDNKVHTVSYMTVASGGSFFGNSKKSEVECGELAAWGSDISPRYEAVVYDQTHGRFLRLVQYASPSEMTQFPAQDPSAAFDINNVGMTMLMGDWGRGAMPTYSNGYDYMFMQKGNERYLAVADFSAVPTSTNVGIGLYDITNSPNIANVTSIAAAYLGEYVLYGAGNKVYNLAYNASTVAKDAWTAPSADEEVTCVRLQKYYFGSLYRMMLPNPNTVVHIATWNEKTQEGKLYQCSIDPASGAIGEVKKTYTVPGKVKDMGWKYIMEM